MNQFFCECCGEDEWPSGIGEIKRKEEEPRCTTCKRIKSDPVGDYCSNSFHVAPPEEE